MTFPVWGYFLVVGVILVIIVVAATLYTVYHFLCRKTNKPSDSEPGQPSPEQPVMVKVSTLKRPSSSQSCSTEKNIRVSAKNLEKVDVNAGGKTRISMEKAPKSKERQEKSVEKTKPPSKAPEMMQEVSAKGSDWKPKSRMSKMEAPGEQNDNIRSKRSLDKMNEIWDVDFDTVTTNSNTKRPTIQEGEPTMSGAAAVKARARKTRSTNK